MTGKATLTDQALPPLRALLREAGVPFKIVGGVAVHHHGFERATEDLDVIVEASAVARMQATLQAHGFERESSSRLRHVETGVRVDVLVSGVPLARRPEHTFPRPQDIEPSPRDGEVAGLGPLLRLKLLAGRHRDVADVVELLKMLEDAEYIHIEAAIDPELRSTLAQLRDEALEELSWDQH